MTVDLVALGFFKYYGFFIDSTAHLLDDLDLGAPLPLLTVALPVGLSFFTFQAISYVVDVRRGLCERATTIDVGIYLSFFPHLVAGPIVRAREFLPQLATPRDPRDVAVGAGVLLIAFGLIKKVVIADFLARSVVDPVFAVPEAYGAPDAWTALLGYAVQIFCDFSGYTDIAIGLALLMGFIFPQNFNRPYSARSVREFWRRWHMTLSRYLRDFLYIPLGGNRGGPVKTARNLMITMLLGGLWHGAAWGFVLWGGLHGAALVFEHAVRGRGPRLPAVGGVAYYLHVRLPGVDPVPRAGSRHGVGLHATPRHARAVDAAQPRRCRRCARHPCPATAARTPPGRRARTPAGAQPRRARRRAGDRRRARRRLRARQRGATLHLLPVLGSIRRMQSPDHDKSATASIPAPPTGRHVTARDAIICIGLCTLLLVLFEGPSLRRSGEEMRPGWERSLVLGAGRPARGADGRPRAGGRRQTGGLGASRADTLGARRLRPGERERGRRWRAARDAGRVRPARALGQQPVPPRPLRTVLVTGDSLAQPLDAKIARAFSKANDGVKVVRDARIGTGISQTDVVDWGRLSVAQVRKQHPDAIVVFMGANEGFPMRSGGHTVKCCGAPWAAAYAYRVRQVMSTFGQAGTARVYWLNLPAPRDGARRQISRAVNAAIAVAAEPYRAQVRVVSWLRFHAGRALPRRDGRRRASAHRSRV